MLPTRPPPSEAPGPTLHCPPPPRTRMALLGRLRGRVQSRGALGWQVRVRGGPGGEGRATTQALVQEMGQEGPERALRDPRLHSAGVWDLDGSRETLGPETQQGQRAVLLSKLQGSPQQLPPLPLSQLCRPPPSLPRSPRKKSKDHSPLHWSQCRWLPWLQPQPIPAITSLSPQQYWKQEGRCAEWAWELGPSSRARSSPPPRAPLA